MRFQFQRARHIPQMQRSQIGRSPLEGVRPFAEGFPVMGADGMAEEGGILRVVSGETLQDGGVLLWRQACLDHGLEREAGGQKRP